MFQTCLYELCIQLRVLCLFCSLLLLLSEVCVGQIGPVGALRNIHVKKKCSHLYKHCFPIHLPGKLNPACIDDIKACSYENNLGAVGPNSDFLIISPVGSNRLFYHFYCMGNSKYALRSY